ncbi:MAG: sulfur carrier protein ThiS [Rikenellaceae bacterium]
MKIIFNGEQTDINSTHISELLEELSIESKGIAIGLNSRVIPRTQWSTQQVVEGDQIVVVSAVFGG